MIEYFLFQLKLSWVLEYPKIFIVNVCRMQIFNQFKILVYINRELASEIQFIFIKTSSWGYIILPDFIKTFKFLIFNNPILILITPGIFHTKNPKQNLHIFGTDLLELSFRIIGLVEVCLELLDPVRVLKTVDVLQAQLSYKCTWPDGSIRITSCELRRCICGMGL